ncbi:shugoshin isoform X2 [Drosophila kikkawai]|uniref:Shugoshin isoform X2 n=1 Tax=Drosophila kikkawai TaxID=30033 RepID=A0ABM4GCK6_DROKI
MASKVEQQYKLLNAQLMDHVQKQRMELGLYKKEVTNLRRENMELRQARILENYRMRQDHICFLKCFMRRMDIDLASLADSTPPESPAGQRRRSSKEMCQEMRQSSALACSTRTVSPSRHRDTMAKAPNMAPKITLTTSSQSGAEIENDVSSALAFTVISEESNEESSFMHTTPQRLVPIANNSACARTLAVSPRRSGKITEKPTEAPRLAPTTPQRVVQKAEDSASALAGKPKMFSPTRRRGKTTEKPTEAPRLAPTTPQRVLQKANDGASASALACSPRRRGKTTEKPTEAPRLAQPKTPQRVVQKAEDSASALAGSSKIFSPTRRRGKTTEKPKEVPGLAQPTTPQRVVQKANDGASASALAGSPKTCPGIVPEEPNKDPKLTNTPLPGREENVENDGSSDEEIIVDDSLAGTIMADYSLGLDLTQDETSSSDSSFDNFSPPRRPLRLIDQNVKASGRMKTRSSARAKEPLLLDTDNATKEQPSIQVPRLVLTPASPKRDDSLMGSPSFRSQASQLKRSLFERNFHMRASNTSTPIANRSSPEHTITTAKETSEILARSSIFQPTVRIRKLKSEPGAEQTTDLSTTCHSSSSSNQRPSRRCRPTKLSEPSLRDKLRNPSVGKKKNKE